jgi:uncharacterized protein YgbK (DUF1537 family)
MTYRALVVADDLTGAMDSGHEFAARGFDTVVTLVEEQVDSDVLVVDTDSRSASASAAERAVEEAIDIYPAALVYKKVDSTLRGNPIAETDTAIAAAEADLALVAPAFPATGRTTVDGAHLVDGVPVTEALDDAGTPPTSHLPTLLADSAYPVATCPIACVERGSEAIRASFPDVGEPVIVVPDASSEEHLDAIARAVAENDRRVLFVGSAGLARHVRLPEGGSTNRQEAGGEATNGEPTDDGSPKPERTPTGGVLGIAGSAHPRTIEQLGALSAERVIELDVARAVTDPATAATAASTPAIEALSDGQTAVVTSVPDREAIERAREAGAAAGVEDVGERLERALATVAGEVYAEHTPEGLFLTGGAIAIGVLDELDATGVRPTGEAIERGVPVGAVLGGHAHDTATITKAGGFGTERTIANCLACLRQGDQCS